MIKFFRSKRKDLLEEGKTGRYLKYAVGEIALVVIGILIALSINNKNTELKNKAAEQNFYANTRQQLLDDAHNIEEQIVYNTTYAEQFRYAIVIIDSMDRAKKDSLGKIAVNLMNYSDFDRQGNIYETMVNSGEIKLIRNPEIIEQLRRLEETYLWVNRMEAIHLDVVKDLAPHLMRSIRFQNAEIKDEDFLYDYQFQNFFLLSLRIMGEKDVAYQRALEEISSLVGQLDDELK